jgi:hypothetical protein
MIRFAPFAFLGASILLWAGSSLAQQHGTPGGQAQTKGQPPPTQIQPPPTQTQPPATQAIQPQGQPSSFQNPIHYGAMTQTPFFSNTAIQQHLNLTAPQANQLNQNYGSQYMQYMKDLSAGQATQAKSNSAGITMNFNNQMLKSAQGVLDPTQFQRFRQLHWQGQGFNTFNDPTVIQQLNLTAAQQAKIQTYAQQQSPKANDIFASSSTNPQAAAQQYQALRSQNDQYINSVLTPEQQQTLRTLLGQPYDLAPVGGTKK